MNHLYNILFFLGGFGTCIFLLFILSLFITKKDQSVEDLRDRVNRMSKENIKEPL